MSVRLYAICAGDAQAPAGAGLGGAKLRMVRDAGLAALVSEAIDGVSLEPHEDLWQHELAVESLMREGDVLPARFGTVVPDEEAIRRVLRERATEFHAALERIAGAVEIGVRAALLADPGARTAPLRRAVSGADYMRGAKDAEERTRQLRARLDQALAPLSRSARSWRGRGAAAVRSAYLVDRDSVERFKERAARLNEEEPFAELACTGPWPPYSFVAATAGVC